MLLIVFEEISITGSNDVIYEEEQFTGQKHLHDPERQV